MALGARPAQAMRTVLASGMALVGIGAVAGLIASQFTARLLQSLDAFRQRHVYAATDNILADVESGSHLAGDEFSTSELPTLKVKLQGTSSFAKVVIVRDGKYVYSTSPNSQTVEFAWRDNHPNKGKASYYYVRGEQDNGELVWVSPLWITYTGN